MANHKKEPTDDNKVKLVLGYLTAVKGDLKERQGLAISGAISMAVEEVTNHIEYLLSSDYYSSKLQSDNTTFHPVFYNTFIILIGFIFLSIDQQ